MAARRNGREARPRFIVSACLAGINCTYRGGNKHVPAIERLVSDGQAIAVCPEVMGGLIVPRENSELVGGDGSAVLSGTAKAISKSGTDLTPQYLAGAQAILHLAKRNGITKAILKTKSPACGCGAVYDGTFRKVLRRGNGVLAALLLKHRISVATEHSL